MAAFAAMTAGWLWRRQKHQERKFFASFFKTKCLLSYDLASIGTNTAVAVAARVRVPDLMA
jgi:hypothetical protein